MHICVNFYGLPYLVLMPLCLFYSYFETYGTIPELSVGQTEEKFAALRKAADVTTSKGEHYCNYCNVQHIRRYVCISTVLTVINVFYREC